MAYVSPNYKTKKLLKEALVAGKFVEVFQPGLGTIPENGTVSLEGPHYRHRWYVTGVMIDGRLVSVQCFGGKVLSVLWGLKLGLDGLLTSTLRLKSWFSRPARVAGLFFCLVSGGCAAYQDPGFNGSRFVALKACQTPWQAFSFSVPSLPSPPLPLSTPVPPSRASR